MSQFDETQQDQVPNPALESQQLHETTGLVKSVWKTVLAEKDHLGNPSACHLYPTMPLGFRATEPTGGHHAEQDMPLGKLGYP